MNRLGAGSSSGSSEKVGDAGFVAVAECCKSLKVLYARGTAIGDAGLKALAANGKMVEAHLEHCKRFTDVGVKALAECPLESVHLGGTAVTDVGAKGIAACSTLTMLYVGGTAVTDECEAEIDALIAPRDGAHERHVKAHESRKEPV